MLPAAVCEVGQLGSAGVAVGEDDGVGSCRFDGHRDRTQAHLGRRHHCLPYNIELVEEIKAAGMPTQV